MKNYSQKELVEETAKGHLYDYIANHYYEMTTYELKEVLLAVLGVGYDSCKGEQDEKAYANLLVEELGNRDFGAEEE